jgi:hypothetical protein
VGWFRPQQADRRQPVHPRHLNIHQDQLGLDLVRPGYGLKPGSGDDDRVAVR